MSAVSVELRGGLRARNRMPEQGQHYRLGGLSFLTQNEWLTAAARQTPLEQPSPVDILRDNKTILPSDDEIIAISFLPAGKRGAFCIRCAPRRHHRLCCLRVRVYPDLSEGAGCLWDRGKVTRRRM